IVAVGAHLWLTGPAERADFSARERNRDEVRLVAVTPPVVAARSGEESRRTMLGLAGAACVEFAGIAGPDIPRGRDALAALKIGDRLTERRVEEITRHWVFIGPLRDRRAAEERMTQLRRGGIGEMSVRPDNAISLGVFSTEEAARRFLGTLEGKGIRDAQAGPLLPGTPATPEAGKGPGTPPLSPP